MNSSICTCLYVYFNTRYGRMYSPPLTLITTYIRGIVLDGGGGGTLLFYNLLTPELSELLQRASITWEVFKILKIYLLHTN